MGLLGAYWLVSLVDARTPLLVADAQGIRIRLGRAWRGLPWTAVHHVEHTPRAACCATAAWSSYPQPRADRGRAHRCRQAPHRLLPPAARRSVRRAARALDARHRRRRRPDRGARPRGARRQPDRRGRADARRGRGPESVEAAEPVEARRGRAAPRPPRRPRHPRSSEPEVVVAASSPARRRPRCASQVAARRSEVPRDVGVDEDEPEGASCAAPAGSAWSRRPSRGATGSVPSPGRVSRSSRWCSTTSRSSPPRTRSSVPSSPRPAPASASPSTSSPSAPASVRT